MESWRQRVAVTWEPTEDAALRAEAVRLAGELRVRVVAGWGTPGMPISADMPEITLVVTPQRLELRVLHGDPALVGGRGVAPEFEKIDVTSGPGRSLQAPLLKAVGIRKGDAYRPRVLDATAGLGEDAWLLAAAGCEVVAVERQPVIAALLRDAVDRAHRTTPTIAERIKVVTGEALKRGAEEGEKAGRQASNDPAFPRVFSPDVVYLDPMFPVTLAGGRKRKTAERKPMRVLRLLAGEDEDADALLAPALAAAGRRVVVKRPTKADPLARRTPTVTHEGRGFRFDVYVVG